MVMPFLRADHEGLVPNPGVVSKTYPDAEAGQLIKMPLAAGMIFNCGGCGAAVSDTKTVWPRRKAVASQTLFFISVQIDFGALSMWSVRSHSIYPQNATEVVVIRQYYGEITSALAAASRDSYSPRMNRSRIA